MNPQDQIPMPEESIDELDADTEVSVDDFIRELEEKERDLHITSDLSIEIAELDIDMSPAQTFIEQDVAAAEPPPKAPAAKAAAVPAPVKARNLALENEVATLKVRVMELKNERSEQQEKNDRRVKDFENYKYRMDRERRGSFIDQIANLATQMLPVVDNLNRAIDSVPQHAEEKDPAFSQFFDGIVLVSQQVNEVFAGMGVEPIKTAGEAFDPNFHEAVAVEETNDLPANTIVDELLSGYRIGNKVIRHSMVKVTTSGPKPVAEPAPVPTPENSETTPDASFDEADG